MASVPEMVHLCAGKSASLKPQSLSARVRELLRIGAVSAPVQRNLLGPAIKDIRHRREYSQQRLADLLVRHGWKAANRETIAKIENGSRCIADYELVMLGTVLKVPLNKLAKAHSSESLKAVFQFS